MREMGARRCPPGGKKVCSRAASAIGAGGPAVSLLHSEGEAVSRVRSHISPGPYRSFRELSLAGSVDPVTWCPPTFVGNSGIERSNGHRGFALFCLPPRAQLALSSYPAKAGYPVRSGLAVLLRALWNTGSPAFAGDDVRI